MLSFLKGIGLSPGEITRLDVHHVLRWHPIDGGLVALMVDAGSGSPIGAQVITLDEFGDVRRQQYLGRRGLICLKPHEDIERGLALAIGLDAGLRAVRFGVPVWALPDLGSLAMFKTLSGVSITIYARPGEMSAADRLVEKWQEKGEHIEVSIVPLV